MIIVTGGAGFIGSNIIMSLNKKGIKDILVVDNLLNYSKTANLVNLDIADYLDKEDFFMKIELSQKFGDVKAIFHEGACSSTIKRNGKYVMNNNYNYSKKLLHYCLIRRIPFLYASSAAVYGYRTSDFIESREYEKPLNIYGYSKFLFDEYVRGILSKANSQVVGFRYFNVYGPNERHKGRMASVIFHLNTQFKNGESLKLFKGSEKFKRDFIYVNDVIDVNMWFLKNGISGIFNVGTGYAKSFYEVANVILEYYKQGKIKYIPFPKTLKEHYQIFTQANLNNLRKIGYKKSFKTINEGIIEYLIWLNQQ